MRQSIVMDAPSPEVAHSIIRGFKKITDQTGKHRYIAKIARLTDLSETKLDQVITKMSPLERKKIYKAFLDLQRVAQSVAKAESVK